MKSSIVQSSWLGETGRRLDPGPYLSGAIEAKAVLVSLRAKKTRLGDLTLGGDAGVFHAGRIGRTYVSSPEFGLPFLGSTDILSADLSYLPFLSKRLVEQHPQFLIRKDWSLITRSGNIGRMSFARADMDGMACSEHVMRVIPDLQIIPPGYLYAFLRSRFGVPMITSGTYGAIIQHIEPEHIVDLPVPRLGNVEQTAHELISEASRLRTFCQHRLNEATSQLFRAVGLRDITGWDWHSDGPDLGFPAKSVNQSSLRALNFNPRLGQLITNLKAVRHREFGDVCLPDTLRRGGRFKRIDADEQFGVELVGQKQLFWSRSEGRFLAKKALPAEVFVEDGSILVAARGTLGESEIFCRAEFVWGQLTRKAYSEDLLRIIADKSRIEPGYLFAFVRSESMFRMLRSISTGTKLQDHHPRFLALLPIPIADDATREAIHRMVVEGATAKNRALALEDKATNAVEQAIEGGR